MKYEYKNGVLYCGNCLDVLNTFPDNSVDSIVTDPPYGIKFMSKKWDYDVPGVEIWIECLRVLKPGGHLLSFAGTRTFHRMTCNIEDAGFEIRDMIAWIYGTGFPKSLNISKAIDRLAGVEREIIDESKRHGGGSSDIFKKYGTNPITAPATEDAKKWDGFGTALKPAIEPVTLARKPLSEKNIAENVLKHGTGGINIDDCRLEYKGEVKNTKRKSDGNPDHVNPGGWKEVKRTANRPSTPTEKGRFPANVILDGSEEVLKHFPETNSSGSGLKRLKRKRSGFKLSGSHENIQEANAPDRYGDSGSAARFFYIAKADKKDKDKGLDNTALINIIRIWKTEKNIIKEEKQASLRVNMDISQKKVIGVYGIQKKNVFEWSTFLFGKKLTEKYQKDIAYTTLTETSLTMKSIIYNYLICLLTKEYTRVVSLKVENGINLVENAIKCNQLIITIKENPGFRLSVKNAVYPLQFKINVIEKNNHVTVKPVKLMRYLIRLVTPPGGTILDPFMGSGSTGKAAFLEQKRFIGIEINPDYFELSKARIEKELEQPLLNLF